MPFASFILVEEVLRRRYYRDLEHQWAHLLQDSKIEDNLNRGEGLLRTGVTVRIGCAEYCRKQ
jgi:hypothetical protein